MQVSRMEQIERIMYMEKALNTVTEAVSSLEKSLEAYSEVSGLLQELTAYYMGEQWRQDYEDDCAGKLPGDLKRGVLSEDAVYDLLSDHDRIMEQLKDLVGRQAE